MRRNHERRADNSSFFSISLGDSATGGDSKVGGRKAGGRVEDADGGRGEGLEGKEIDLLDCLLSIYRARFLDDIDDPYDFYCGESEPTRRKSCSTLLTFLP